MAPWIPSGYISPIVAGSLRASCTASFHTTMFSFFPVMSEPHFSLFTGGLVAGVKHQRPGQGEGAVVSAPGAFAAAHGFDKVLHHRLVRPSGFRNHLIVCVLA